MKASSLRDEAQQAAPNDPWSESSSDSGIRHCVLPRGVDRKPAERATVVFRGMFPIEGLVHFIRRNAQTRMGQQDVSARVEAPDQHSWEVSLQVDELEVIGRANDPFVATLRAFDLLPCG